MAFYEIDEAVFDTVPVYGTAGQAVNAAVPKSGATVNLRDAGTSTARTAYDAPSGTVLSSLTTVNGRIEGPSGQRVFVAGETPVDVIVNLGQPNQQTLTWSPPQLGPPGPTGGATWTSVGDYPLIVPETDDAARIARAYAALNSARGGVLYFPFGFYQAASLPSLMGSQNITFKGNGGRSGGASTATVLVFTGTGPRGIDARGSYGFVIEDMELEYTSAGFTGKLVDWGHSSGTTPANRDAAFAGFNRCTVSGAGVSTASMLASTANAHSITFRDTLFQNAVAAVVGRDSAGDYSNAIAFEDCHFGQTTQAPLQSAGQGWHASGCVFEGLQDGSAGAFWQQNGQAYGLTFDNGCWFGDASNATPDPTSGGHGNWGRWVVFAGGGLAIEGNYIGGGDAPLKLLANSTSVRMQHNKIVGNNGFPMSTGIEIGSGCRNVEWFPNEYTNVTTRATFTDSPGQVGPPRARSVLATAATAATGHTSSGAWQKVPLDTSLYDNDTIWDAANHRFVVNAAGVYTLVGQVTFGANATGQRFARILTGPSGALLERGAAATNGSSVDTLLNVAATAVDLNAGDYIELWAWQNSGGSLAYVLNDSASAQSYRNHLSAVRIG